MKIKKLALIFAIASIAINAYAAQESKEQHEMRYIASNAACILLATPNDAIINKIAADISSVEKNGYIGIESPSISNGIIIDKLVEAAQKGTRVQTFVNDPNKENNPERLINIYNYLKNKNIIVTELSNLHAKRIVIAKNIPAKDQDKIVYLGSLNMTENSPYNHEIMMRCIDPILFHESYDDQHRLGKPFYNRSVGPVDFISGRIINSSAPQADVAKKTVIEEFSGCSTHPHDYLYFAAYTLDDPEIVTALIKAKQNSNKPIKVILDGVNWEKHKTSIIKPLVLANVDVYIFNKDKSKKTQFNHPKSMHIKAILRQCNQKCLSFISTANFTKAGRQDINHDLWQPCSFVLSEQLKRILDNVIQESEKLNPRDFQPLPVDGTPNQMGQKLLELMKYNETTLANINEILRLIAAGADLTLTEPLYGATALIKAIRNNNIEIIQALIDANANVNQTSNHNSALLSAASSGHTQIVQLLIDEDITPTLNFTDQFGNTPLFMAVSGNYIEIVKALLKAGADPNKPGDYREATRWLAAGSKPPLVQAVSRGNLEIVKLLLGAGADFYAKDRENKTAFDHAAGKPEILNLLNDVKFARENAEQIMSD